MRDTAPPRGAGARSAGGPSVSGDEPLAGGSRLWGSAGRQDRAPARALPGRRRARAGEGAAEHPAARRSPFAAPQRDRPAPPRPDRGFRASSHAARTGPLDRWSPRRRRPRATVREVRPPGSPRRRSLQAQYRSHRAPCPPGTWPAGGRGSAPGRGGCRLQSAGPAGRGSPRPRPATSAPPEARRGGTVPSHPSWSTDRDPRATRRASRREGLFHLSARSLRWWRAPAGRRCEE